MKNAFNQLINRLDTAKERISELEDISVEIVKTESKWEKDWEKKTRIPKNYRTVIKGVHIMEKERNKQKKYLKQ
jgi:hypothetical protein